MKRILALVFILAMMLSCAVFTVSAEGGAPASLTDTLDSDKVLDESLLVMSNSDALAEASAELADTASDYFAAVRLSRQEARDSAVNLLQEAMAYDSGSGESGQELEELVAVALSEAQIESLVVAKGYADCVAYMSDDGISVAVASPENGLQENDVALITDIIMTQSDYELEEIRIVPVQ
jgi:stage III sporulation protein AH